MEKKKTQTEKEGKNAYQPLPCFIDTETIRNVFDCSIDNASKVLLICHYNKMLLFSNRRKCIINQEVWSLN